MTTVSSMATTYYWKRPETALVVFQAGGLSHCSSFIPKYDLFWMVYVYTKGNNIIKNAQEGVNQQIYLLNLNMIFSSVLFEEHVNRTNAKKWILLK